MPILDIFSFYKFWGGYSGSCSLRGLEYAFTFWHSYNDTWNTGTSRLDLASGTTKGSSYLG